MDYYEKNAEQYINKTLFADMSECMEKFVSYIPANGLILDAGCGSGRDSKAFKDLGFQVEAFDASPKLAAFASQLIDQPVATMKFSEMKWEQSFEGVWACASLVHLDEDDLHDALLKIYRALKPEGVFYTSFKYGEKVITDGERVFYNRTEEMCKTLIKKYYTIKELFLTGDVLPDRQDTRWVNIIAAKSNDLDSCI